MTDIIHVLPDSVANQIAAGEVVQRPASVVKELIENAIDAGGTNIQVYIKDAGRTLIQIIDNGQGMSNTDARLAFERHATSKIRTAEDIFSIHTMGFRGEALASIAAVAQVECKTKQQNNALGTLVLINGSQIEKHEDITCKNGTNFIIKNLFYNIPARRKFLKTNNVEFAQILTEINRIAIPNPGIAITLHHDDKLLFSLPESGLKQRIVGLLGKQYEKTVLPLESESSLVKIFGFIGTPEAAKKKNLDQYFFVNNRFMKHKSFYGSVMRAYEKVIPHGYYPSYFIFFEIDPSCIDVNIHPTKTEIKFTNEYQIAQILEATVKESLGKFNIVPSLDFNDRTNYQEMFRPSSGPVKIPTIEVDPYYNPFQQSDSNNKTNRNSNTSSARKIDTGNQNDWEKLYSGIKNDHSPTASIFETKPSSLNTGNSHTHPSNITNEGSRFFQLKGRYILTAIKSGLMIIDQIKAHERILYEQFLRTVQSEKAACQKTLFPQVIELSPTEFVIVKEIQEEIKKLGFDIEEFGKNTIVINGIPADIEIAKIEDLIFEFIQTYISNNDNLQLNVHEKIARSLAISASIKNKQLTLIEMQKLIDQLFECKQPNYSPNGKKTIEIITIEELQKRFF